jgi:hypothetical protein
MKPKRPFDKGRTPRKTLNAVFPRVYKVRDIELHPLTTVSFMALDRLESPLLSGQHKLRVVDVANALFVCSRTAEQLERLMAASDPEFRILCAQWCKGIPPEVVLESISVISNMLGEALSTYVASKNPK